MSGDLILGGLFQGWSWAALQPWDASIRLSIPFWSVRLVAGVVIFAAQILFMLNFYLTWRKAPRTTPVTEPASGLATA